MTFLHASLITPCCMLLMFSAGCGSSSQPLGMVRGTVKIGEIAAKEGEISIFSVSMGSGANFIIQPDGQYQSVDPIPVGEYQVAITGVRPNPGMRPPYPVSAIPKKYSGLNTSGLTLQVKQGRNEVNFNLDKK